MPAKHHPLSAAISIAACALSLPALAAGENQIRVQLLPCGEFRPIDGRTIGISDKGSWFIDAAIAHQVIDRAQSRATKICIDYDHQTLHKEKNGQPAPAAAWLNQNTLEWVEGEGLFGVATLTPRAAQGVAGLEWLYFSPVFFFDQKTGAVLDLRLGALTNTPGIDDMEPLTAAAHQTFAADLAALSQQLSTIEDTHMDELLEQLRWMLGMPVGTTPEEYVAQLQKVIDQIKTGYPTAVAAANFSLADLLASQQTQVAALSQQIATPDPARFVPISIMIDLQGQVAALSQRLNTGEADGLVDKALADGRLLPAQEAWARGLGKTNMAALSQYLQTAPAIAALNGSQTAGRTPPTDLTLGSADDDALAVCSQLGLTPDEFAKGKLG
jgi:phage I-like protein